MWQGSEYTSVYYKGVIQKYVTCKMAFFEPPSSHVTLCHLLSSPLPLYHSLKATHYGVKQKKIFAIYGCLSISHYSFVPNCKGGGGVE